MGNIKSNQQYNAIRNNLEARSLYNPNNPYQIENPKLVTAINSIASLIPGKSINIQNTPYGRLLGVGAQTPITIIGAEMYARSISQSVTSNVISDSLPSVNFRNLFDGNPNTHLLTKKEDYRITRDETKSSIGRLIQDITNQQPKLANSVFTGRGNVAPFDKFPNQYDYIRNTGKGQLNQYYGSIGKNLYIQSSEDFISVAEDQGYKVDKKALKVLDAKSFFPTNDPFNFPDGENASAYVNAEMQVFRESSTEDRISEYGSNPVTNAMGSSNKSFLLTKAQNQPNQPRTDDFEFEDGQYGFNENINDQIIWGVSGTSEALLNFKFGVRSGALLYTKGLLQARGARAYFDQTKKKYTNQKDRSLMYNGSPLTRDIDGQQRSERQSTILDPYNNFAKAIRFKGNDIYQAPVESVINKSVIPKFHPIKDDKGKINRDNMMFSIENLAYILNDKGYLGDQLGTKVPESEVGANRGRLMWFAPYDVQVSETASAKYEATQFIGRSEPVYSYQTSERSARLGFKLIVDYPPQVDGRSHGDIAKFFAFGGRFKEEDLKNIDIDKETANLKRDEEELSKIQPTEDLARPEGLITGEQGRIFFQNDVRNVDSVLQVYNGTGSTTYTYEDGIKNSAEPNDDSLNSGFVKSIQKLVTEILSEQNWKFYVLNFHGGASLLYYNRVEEKFYNDKLREDRAKSLRSYVEKIFKNNTGLTFEKAGIKTIITIDEPPKPRGDGSDLKPTSTWDLDIKSQRYAKVVLEQNSVTEKKIIPISTDQQNQKKDLEEQIASRKTLINAAKNVDSDGRLFNEIKFTDRAMRGFESFKKGDLKFSPVFHSQTPEDFHRRLTFLHQCTRQGNAVINKSTTDGGISAPKNSVFGRPPICVFRLGDMFHSKVIIETIDFDFSEAIWDVNPEGMGMQYMIADIDISMKIIGGQSLKGAVDVIQNAESFNYYANSTFYKNDVYRTASAVESAQVTASSSLLNAKGQARFGTNITGFENSGSFSTKVEE